MILIFSIQMKILNHLKIVFVQVLDLRFLMIEISELMVEIWIMIFLLLLVMVMRIFSFEQ